MNSALLNACFRVGEAILKYAEVGHAITASTIFIAGLRPSYRIEFICGILAILGVGHILINNFLKARVTGPAEHADTLAGEPDREGDATSSADEPD